MPFYKDQLGRDVELPQSPQRIVSVVPSQTELLFDLGLEKEIVGITKFCVHPEQWFRTRTRIGGTKQLDLHKIKQLQPGLIIANKEENLREQIEELERYFPVWVSDVNTLHEALSMIDSIGLITGKNEAAQKLNFTISKGFSQLHNSGPAPRVCYLIWKDPYMTVGHDTFINDMLIRCGFQNIFENKTRYPAITVEELQLLDCEYLLLSSEPYPFRQKHMDELQAQLPGVNIVLVDGEMFSWYGSRLQYAFSYFEQLQARIGSIS